MCKETNLKWKPEQEIHVFADPREIHVTEEKDC